MDTQRFEELRRRVQKDPASFVFAQLAEEYRRAGEFRSAIETCRAGLALHPDYHSARVILARCLFEFGDLPSAEAEFRMVVRSAPDNLTASRGLADIHQALGSKEAALANEPDPVLAALEGFLRTIVAYRGETSGSPVDDAR